MNQHTKALQRAMGLFRKPHVTALKKKDVSISARPHPVRVSKSYIFKPK